MSILKEMLVKGINLRAMECEIDADYPTDESKVAIAGFYPNGYITIQEGGGVFLVAHCGSGSLYLRTKLITVLDYDMKAEQPSKLPQEIEGIIARIDEVGIKYRLYETKAGYRLIVDIDISEYFETNKAPEIEGVDPAYLRMSQSRKLWSARLTYKKQYYKEGERQTVCALVQESESSDGSDMSEDPNVSDTFKTYIAIHDRYTLKETYDSLY